MSTLFGKSKHKRQRPANHDNNKQIIDSFHKDEDNISTNHPSLEDIDKIQKVDDGTTTGTTTSISIPTNVYHQTFETLGLAEQLVQTCRQLGLNKPTPVQRTVIPYLLQKTKKTEEDPANVLVLSETGSGKTAAFVLPIIHHCIQDPYGIFAVVVTPTRELAKQIHQQIIAFGTLYKITSCLVIGGLDAIQQANQLHSIRPHFVVATPGRFAELLRGPQPPRIQHCKYIVFDEADRLLASGSGFEKDIAELLLHCRSNSSNGTDGSEIQMKRRKVTCQMLFFTATMSKSLECIEEMTSSSVPLMKFNIDEDGQQQQSATGQKKKQKSLKNNLNELVGDSEEIVAGSDLDEDNDDEGVTPGVAGGGKKDGDEIKMQTPKIPAGLKQEYIFMPARVRDAYLLTTIRTLMQNGGRPMNSQDPTIEMMNKHKNKKNYKGNKSTSDNNNKNDKDDDDDMIDGEKKARSAIIFVSTCERAALVSGILQQVGVDNVALHSLLTQNRRLASLGIFQSQHVRVLVATDVASRGLDIPFVDLIINCELPRNCTHYIHRVGRTARAGRRGRAVSLVSERDIQLIQLCEQLSGRTIEKCMNVTDEMVLPLLGSTAKATRLTQMKLLDIGFDQLVNKMKERKVRDRKERIKKEQRLV